MVCVDGQWFVLLHVYKYTHLLQVVVVIMERGNSLCHVVFLSVMEFKLYFSFIIMLGLSLLPFFCLDFHF